MNLPGGIVALGLVQGSLAGLTSMGLVLLWRTNRVVNLAQPALGLAGGVLAGLLVSSAGWSFWVSAPIGLVAGAVCGLGVDRLVLARLRDAPRAVLLVATVGLAQVFAAFQTALPLAFGGPLPTYSINLGFTIDVFPVRLGGAHILALIALPCALLALSMFLYRSRTGLAALALGQDTERARALGVPAVAVSASVWAVAGAVAAVSGILAIPVLGFSLDNTPTAIVLLLALAPAVLAGLRSLAGAAVAALALGVAYQACLWWAPRAGVADLLLGGTVLVAVALRGGRLGRAEAASRTSSWSAAATPRPLPWAGTSLRRVRVAAGLGFVVVVVGAGLPPVFFSPSDDLLYGTSAALAVGALGAAAAWMFAGEVPLGHWGIAGFGAVAAALVPGPWPIGYVAGAAAGAVVAVALALTSRRETALSFAALGLAAAVAAPALLAEIDSRGTSTIEPGFAAAAAGIIAILVTVGLARVRGSSIGARWVAARDEPQRSITLGIDPRRARLAALAVSGAIAGLAGGLYLASSPALAPGAFGPDRSLTVLAMAVVGGLGSPAGALLGAASIQAARLLLPGPWQLIASGVGMLIVVLFLPAGLGRGVERVRDILFRALVGRASAPPAPGQLPPSPERVPVAV